MSIRHAWLLGWFGAALAVACGGSTDSNNGGAGAAGGAGGSGGSGGGAGTGGIPVTDLPEAYAQAVCAAVEDCMGGAFGLFLGGQDCETLLTRQVNSGDITQVAELIAEGKVVYHPELAQACLDSVSGRGCDAFRSGETAECTAALDGTVAEGGDCIYDIECSGDRICAAATACPGTCQARGSAGAQCEQDDDCAPSLVCNDAGVCAANAGTGQACGGSTGVDCDMGELCLGEDSQQGTPGTCTAFTEVFTGADGQACSITEGPWCSPELSCVIESVGASGLVSACRTRVASGAACNLAVPDQCPDGEYCNVPPPSGTSFPIAGTCTPRPAAGEPCAESATSGGDGLCAVYLYCDAGTCRARGDLGATCTDGNGCWSDTCVDGSCVIASACN